MSLDARLKRARADYQSKGPQTGLPGVATGAPPRPGPRWQWPVLAAAVVAVLGVGVGVVALDDDPSETILVAGPEPVTSSTTLDSGLLPTSTIDESDPDADPQDQLPVPGAVAVYDPVLQLDPVGPYVDGQEVMLRRPDGYTEDWINDIPRLCAVVADDPRGPTETCDPLQAMSTSPLSSTQVNLVLAQQVFTPTGYRDCADPAVTCRIVLVDVLGADRATAPLAFTGEAIQPDASLTVTAGDTDTEVFVVEPAELTPHPSWIELRDADPSRVEEFPAFWISVCAFTSSEPEVSPYGEYLWDEAPFTRPLPYANCDSSNTRSAFGTNSLDEPFEISIPGRIHGYSGWSDCRIDQCFVQVSQNVVTEVDPAFLGGYNLSVTAALVPFDSGRVLPPPAAVRILDTGPLEASQSISVEISGLVDGVTTNIGVCHVDSPWGCGYVGTTFGVGNGVHEFELPATVTGCGPEQCYLELDAQSKGVAPLATAPLPIQN